MVEVEKVESGIVVYRWVGSIDMLDAYRATDATFTLTESKPYAAIIDMSKTSRIPSDIAQMRVNIKVEVQHGLRGYVIYGAPRFVVALIRSLSVLAPTTYQFADDWDEALRLARQLIGKLQP